ncbi:MAG: DUF123 domain-containing protein [Sulfolobales archaeon]
MKDYARRSIDKLVSELFKRILSESPRDNNKRDVYSYILLVKCSEKKIIRTRGREFQIDEGYYIYVGSCGRGCSRVVRHLYSKKRKMFWHIDYLLSECIALEALITPGISEEKLAGILSREEFLKPVKGFGSSDDPHNPSHLFKISIPR